MEYLFQCVKIRTQQTIVTILLRATSVPNYLLKGLTPNHWWFRAWEVLNLDFLETCSKRLIRSTAEREEKRSGQSWIIIMASPVSYLRRIWTPRGQEGT